MGKSFYAFGATFIEVKRAHRRAESKWVERESRKLDAEERRKMGLSPEDHWSNRLARTPKFQRDAEFMKQIKKERREEFKGKLKTVWPRSRELGRRREEKEKKDEERRAKLMSSTGVPAVDWALGFIKPGSALFVARKAFIKTMLDEKGKWAPERGYIKYSGVVNVRGPKGHAPFEVMAYYHPKTNDLKMTYYPRE